MTTDKKHISRRENTNKVSDHLSDAEDDSKTASRRGFFKKLAFGGVALTAAGGAVKYADSMMPSVDPQAAYQKDVDPGDEVIAQREHVLMSQEEKESMVQMFIDNYENNKTEV